MKLRQITFKLVSLVMVFAIIFSVSATTISAINLEDEKEKINEVIENGYEIDETVKENVEDAVELAQALAAYVAENYEEIYAAAHYELRNNGTIAILNAAIDDATVAIADAREELSGYAVEEIYEETKELRFGAPMDFGTAGLRSTMYMGIGCMNRFTVAQATRGIAALVLAEGGAERGVAIAYDSRNMSPEFAEATALCLNANGIKTYIFDGLRPVPELSFAVRELGCTAGIMITASHNPPKYNGYKVYWEDGAQIVSPHDKEIIAEVNKVKDYSLIKEKNAKELALWENYLIYAVALDLNTKIEDEIIEKYVNI